MNSKHSFPKTPLDSQHRSIPPQYDSAPQQPLAEEPVERRPYWGASSRPDRTNTTMADRPVGHSGLPYNELDGMMNAASGNNHSAQKSSDTDDNSNGYLENGDGNTGDDWLYLPGNGMHYTPHLSLFAKYTPFRNPIQFSHTMTSGLIAMGLGNIAINLELPPGVFPGKTKMVHLINVLHVPGAPCNGFSSGEGIRLWIGNGRIVGHTDAEVDSWAWCAVRETTGEDEVWRVLRGDGKEFGSVRKSDAKYRRAWKLRDGFPRFNLEEHEYQLLDNYAEPVEPSPAGDPVKLYSLVRGH